MKVILKENIKGVGTHRALLDLAEKWVLDYFKLLRLLEKMEV